MIINPFTFGTPADRWSFTDREDLLPRLQAIMKMPRQRALVYGRRRMGKTSLIRHAGEGQKSPFLFADLSTSTDLREVAEKLIAAIPVPPEGLTKRVLGILGKYVRIVTLRGGKFALEAELRGQAQRNLEQALDFIDDMASEADACWTVCLDEFQEIRSLAGDKGDWHLRGAIQHHKSVSYIFSGSDHRLLSWMTEPNAAFYKQLEVIVVGPIDPALLAQWIDDRSRRGGLPDPEFGKQVVALGGPCTGDIVRLAKAVFDRFASGKTKGDVIAEEFDAIALGGLNQVFVELWRPLSPTQRLMLRAIATGHRPLANSTLAAYGIKAASTGSKAIEALVDRQILIRIDEKVAFDNPFFQRWVEANAAPGDTET
jgi:hypothetical protein